MFFSSISDRSPLRGSRGEKSAGWAPQALSPQTLRHWWAWGARPADLSLLVSLGRSARRLFVTGEPGALGPQILRYWW